MSKKTKWYICCALVGFSTGMLADNIYHALLAYLTLVVALRLTGGFDD